MIIGYHISGYDNDSYMTGCCDRLFPEAEVGSVPRCGKCGYRTDYRYTNPNYHMRRRTMDFSSTYDGITIVSQRFKEFCMHHSYDNLAFVELPEMPGFFQFYVVGSIIEYEAGTKVNYCDACGQYESVVQPIIKSDKITEPLPDGFYQSDLWLGSGNEKSPLIIISPATKANLDKEGFKNICLVKIEKQITPK